MFIGLIIALLAIYINRKVSEKSAAQMGAWNGWVAAIFFRFIGIIFSGFYIWISNLEHKDFINEFSFMMNVLLVIVAGMFIDLFFSISRIRKFEKADC